MFMFMLQDDRGTASKDKQKIQAATKLNWIRVLRMAWNKN